MAVLAPVGAIFSGTFGNLALAALGIGIQLAAAYFFPQKIKGPRAESLKAQTAKYGDHIARIHGHGKTAGAAIWLKRNKVDEHKETERQGGKALGPEVTTYTYTADFAVALAWNGPALGVPRIWADEKLILDNSAESLEAILNGDAQKAIGVAKGATIRIYLGTQDQRPDPDIEADRGVDNVPAWPGVVYVVFKNFPLDEFGIRLPNIEAEVVMQGSEATYDLDVPDDLAFADILVNTYTSASGVNFAIHTLPNFVRVFEGVINSSDRGGGPYVTARGDVVVGTFGQFEPNTISFYDALGGGLLQEITYADNAFGTFGNFSDIVIDGIDYLFFHQYPNVACFVNSGDDWSLSFISASAISFLNSAFNAGPEYLYYIHPTSNEIYRFLWADGATMVAENIDPPGLEGLPVTISYDVETDSVFIVTNSGIFAYDSALETLLASRTGDFTLGSSPFGAGRIYGPTGVGTILVKHTGATGPLGDVWEYNKSDLSLVRHIAFADTDWITSGPLGTWETSPEYGFIRSNGIFGAHMWFLPRVAKERIPLADVIAAECGFVDLPYDVSLITGDIEGYIVRDGSPPRGVLEDLMRVKFFDFTQANGTTKFFMRTNVASRSVRIPEDMGFSESGDPEPRFASERYVDFREVPRRVVLDYQSVDADYRFGSQSISAPEGLNEGAVPMQFQTALVMTDDEAAQAADIFYNEVLDASNVYQTTVGPKFLELHPGDVVNLDLEEDVRTVGAVVTRMEGDLAIVLDLLLRTTVYTSDAVGVPTPNNPQSLLGIARIAPVFIDGHLMRSQDDGNQFYVGVYPAEGGRFSSGTIYKSNDLGASYAPWLGFQTATLRGLCQSALPDRPHPEAWDYASSLSFFVVSTKGVPNLPSSVTEDELLADDELNAFAIRSGTEWEYVQAAEIVGNTDGTWTISKLLRGRKGTDFAMTGHVSGDPIYYLDPNAIDRPPDGEKDLERIYAAIATSTVFTDQYAVTFTNTSRGWRPWAPWAVRGTRDGSGNLTIDWVRRDRLGQHWPEDGPEDPPMSETTEAYEVYIYDISGGIVRTIEVTGDSQASYSAALQTTDFGSPQDDIMIGVVQMSTTYGAGVERLATV